MALINGTPGNDVLSGTAGVDDTLDGGAGTDTASYASAGGIAGGVIVDLSNGFTFDFTNFDSDTLISIENVTGSAFIDTLLGDAGANVLDGGAGDDFLFGNVGNDTLIGGPGNDMLVGGDGTDTASYASAPAGVTVDLSQSMASDGTTDINGIPHIDSLGGIENVTGSASADSLTGNEFANVLDGGAGNDTMAGGADNDTYVVDSAGDVVTENAGEGTDLVQSSIDYTLGANVENLALTGAGNLNGTGNGLDNVMTGNDGNNVLSGLGGADMIGGGAGDDTLIGGSGDDNLTGGSGADVFKYSFTLTEGKGTTSIFTEWLSDKFGKDFGDHLPDCAPTHQHHHHEHDNDDKHRKDDKHHSKDDDHGKNDKHDKHGEDDGHHSKQGDHNHNHGGDDGRHSQDGCLTEKFFEKNYTEWLKEVVVPDLLAQGFELDANGNGKIKIDINEDSRNGTPRIEGLTKQQLAEMFGDRDSVILRDGCDTEKAFYSNSFTSGNGRDSIAGNDGFDTIVDFTFGPGGDKLEFNGVGAGFTVDQFKSLFKVSDVDTDGDMAVDSTMLALADGTPADNNWGVTVQGAGHSPDLFYGSSLFS